MDTVTNMEFSSSDGTGDLSLAELKRRRRLGSGVRPGGKYRSAREQIIASPKLRHMLIAHEPSDETMGPLQGLGLVDYHAGSEINPYGRKNKKV